MERRRRQEDAQHELLRDLRVELRAAFDVLVQADVARDHDERADAPAREQDRGAGDLLDDLAVHDPAGAAEERSGADLRQHAADVVLEDDHDHDQDHVAERVEDPVERVELEVLRALVGDPEHEEPDQHLHRARAADQQHELVDDEGDDRHVEDVLPAEVAEERDHVSCGSARAGTSASATRDGAARRGDVVDADDAGAALRRRAPPPRARRASDRPTASPVRAPRNPLRETPTTTGWPSAAIRVERGEQREVVLEPFAEADAGVEPDAVRGDAVRRAPRRRAPRERPSPPPTTSP